MHRKKKLPILISLKLEGRARIVSEVVLIRRLSLNQSKIESAADRNWVIAALFFSVFFSQISFLTMMLFYSIWGRWVSMEHVYEPTMVPFLGVVLWPTGDFPFPGAIQSSPYTCL
jgi:hypothetical protein